MTAHPLIDGNKRLGLSAALLLLALNGVRLEAGDDELFEPTMAVASGTMRDVELIAAQMEGWAVPREEGDRL